eukprot:2399549-Prymnesium_polylepis.2
MGRRRQGGRTAAGVARTRRAGGADSEEERAEHLSTERETEDEARRAHCELHLSWTSAMKGGRRGRFLTCRHGCSKARPRRGVCENVARVRRSRVQGAR